MARDETLMQYILLINIPSYFKTADLRTFFSDLIEEGAFRCFHYQHRSYSIKDQLNEKEHHPGNDRCCPLVVNNKYVDRLIAMNDTHWRDRNDETQPGLVKMERVGEPMSTACALGGPLGSGLGGCQKYKSKKDLQDVGRRNSGRKREKGRGCLVKGSITVEEFSVMAELSPPMGMPQGNVGTSIAQFIDAISSCILPPSVIGQLGLVFPSSGQQCKEASYQYEDSSPIWLKENSDDDAEEWERYEALHDDVTNQDRNSERLYEEEVEVTWDKGSSGLVWHTDAAYWKGKELEESDVADWDADTTRDIRYAPKDRDCQDRRDLTNHTDPDFNIDDSHPIVNFEQHTRGIGSKLLRRHGWQPGLGLGHTDRMGLAEPVKAADPRRRKCGLGYKEGEHIATNRDMPRSLLVFGKTSNPIQPITRKDQIDEVSVITQSSVDRQSQTPNEPIIPHPGALIARPTKYIQPPPNIETYLLQPIEKRLKMETEIDNNDPITPYYYIKYRRTPFVTGGIMTTGQEQVAPNYRHSDKHILIGSLSVKDQSILPSSLSDDEGKEIEQDSISLDASHVKPYFTSQGLTTM